MKIKNLINLITENFIVIIICLLISVFLYGMHRASLLERRTFTVPLTIQAEGSMYPMSDWPESVKVTIRSTKENIAEALQSDITATLDLRTYEEEGSYTVPVSLHLAPKLLLMNPFEVSVKPENVSVKMEEKILKYIALEPSFLGEVEHGYEITSTTITPSSVQAIGPRSTLNSDRKFFTSEIDITGLKQTKEYDVKLNNINSHLQVYDTVKNFHVRVVVEPKNFTKKFSSVKVYPIFLQKDLEIEKEIKAISFDINGNMPLLENYELDEKSVFIDCSLIKTPGTYELPVRFSLPTYFDIQNKSDETVKIVVIQKEIEKDNSLSEENL